MYDMSKLNDLLKAKKASLKTKDKTLKPAPGANRYVILPGWRKEEGHVFYHDFGQHYVKNEAGEIAAVYLCHDKTFGNACPVCDGISRAVRSSTDDDTVKLLKDSSAGQSYLLNVLALDSENDAIPQILEIRKSAFLQIVELVQAWGATVFDSAEPQIVSINRDGKGLLTKYTVQISPKKHNMPQGVMSNINNLDDYVRQENEEGQRKALTAINTIAGIGISHAAKSSTPDEDSRDRPRSIAKPAVSAHEISLGDELADLDALFGPA